MSGTFREDQNTEITATDDEALAKRHGLTSFNKATGQWEAPRSDTGVRDGADVERRRHEAAKTEGDAQDKAEADERKAAEQAEAPVKATKATGSKASQSKTGDDSK